MNFVKTFLKKITSNGKSAPALYLEDYRLDEALKIIEQSVTIHQLHFHTISNVGPEGPLMGAADNLGALVGEFSDRPELHYAYASALSLAGQGPEAKEEIEKCCEKYPEFWLAQLASRYYLSAANPFCLPPFNPEKDDYVHSAINEVVQSFTTIPVRRGLIPQTVLFLKDSGNDLDEEVLQSCEIKFTTLISPVNDPQVVSINFEIHDDPYSPYRGEALTCPFKPFGVGERFEMEMFVRQPVIDFFIINNAGRIKYQRRIKPSNRMKRVHSVLIEMFEQDEGRAISGAEFQAALQRHQQLVDIRRIEY